MPRKKSKGDGVSTSKRKRMVHEKMDSYDPDEFIEISVGESISPHQYSRSTDERKADRRMLAQRLEDMILKRALQDNRAIEELGPAVTAGSRARPLREIHAEDNKVEKEVKRRGNRKPKAYTGVSTSQNGCGVRLLGDYEKALRAVRAGETEATCLRRVKATAPYFSDVNTESVHTRVLVSIPTPDERDESAITKSTQFALWCQTVFTDYCQTLREPSPEESSTELLGDLQTAFTLYREVKPQYSVPWTGVNTAHSWTQSTSSHTRPVGMVKDDEKARDACAMCGGASEGYDMNKNRLTALFPWMDKGLIHCTCERTVIFFLSDNGSVQEVYRRESLLACKNWEQLQWTTSLFQLFRKDSGAKNFGGGPWELTSDDSCALCDRPFSMRNPSSGESHDTLLDVTPSAVALNSLPYELTKGIEVVCAICQACHGPLTPLSSLIEEKDRVRVAEARTLRDLSKVLREIRKRVDKALEEAEE